MNKIDPKKESSCFLTLISYNWGAAIFKLYDLLQFLMKPVETVSMLEVKTPNNCRMERELGIVCKAAQDPKSKGVIKVPTNKHKPVDYKRDI